MVVAYHLIWTAYGVWLPNDPRGSMSHEVCADVLKELGEIHYGRKVIQPAGWEIRQFQERARPLLKHDLLRFTDEEIVLIGEAFGEVVKDRRYTCYACAIMPDHVHILIRKHRDKAEEMIERLQQASALTLRQRDRHGENHPVWGGPGWKVFLFSPDDIERTIVYIEQNPIKARRASQCREFVTPYDGWLPGLVSRVKPEGEDNANPQASDERGSRKWRG